MSLGLICYPCSAPLVDALAGEPNSTAIQAAMKADAMLDEGELDGAAVWRRIVAVINDLRREEPEPGEQRQ